MGCTRIDNNELERIEKLIKTNEQAVYKVLLRHDAKLAALACRFGGEIQKAIAEYLRYLQTEGELDEIITEALLNDIAVLESKTAGVLNVIEYGAVGNGVADDTKAIQRAIDDANERGLALHIPKGVYLISAPIVLNGCTLIGDPGNIYALQGTVIKCITKDFTAIKQGSTSSGDIMFNISDILVQDAEIGFEIVYAINSKFERLYASDCTTGFKLGDPAAVGCLFCEFNNLYTLNCSVGVDVNAKDYMNNNRFNNGYLDGTTYALKMAVSGGYGAIGNVFNNVEFRSDAGRGVLLTSCVNTVFNSCYFESAGNALRLSNYCSVTLNNGNFATFETENAFSDVNIIYAEGGGRITISGGTVFLDSAYENIYFFGGANAAIHSNIQVLREIEKNGSASGFDFFSQVIKNAEQIVNTATLVVPASGAAELEFVYEKAFQSVPQFVAVTMRGAAGAEKGLSWLLSSRTADGGKISVTNDSTGDRSVSFSVWAKGA